MKKEIWKKEGIGEGELSLLGKKIGNTYLKGYCMLR